MFSSRDEKWNTNVPPLCRLISRSFLNLFQIFQKPWKEDSIVLNMPPTRTFLLALLKRAKQNGHVMFSHRDEKWDMKNTSSYCIIFQDNLVKIFLWFLKVRRTQQDNIQKVFSRVPGDSIGFYVGWSIRLSEISSHFFGIIYIFQHFEQYKVSKKVKKGI